MTDRRTLFAVAAPALAAAIGAAAQDRSPSELEFEAASIRPSSPGGLPFSGTTLQGNRLRETKVTLLALIRSVHHGDGFTSEQQFAGGPDWIRTERWDVEAVATITPTRAQFNDMMRNLLADRFKVRVRREQRELPVFALLVARDDRRLGPSLTIVNVDCTAYKDAFNRLQSSSTPRPKPGEPLRPITCDTTLSSGPQGTHASGRAIALSQLTQMLTPYFDAPVLDRTGLSGQYDYDLDFVSNPLAADPAAGTSLPTALREQLGLRVERGRAPIDVLVIESAERPTND